VRSHGFESPWKVLKFLIKFPICEASSSGSWAKALFGLCDILHESLLVKILWLLASLHTTVRA